MKRFKHFISEGATKGEDYETVIVNAWNCLETGSKSCKGTKDVPIKVGNAIVTALKSYKLSGKGASRLGDASIDVTSEWSEFFPNGVGGGTKTPKTDVLIGKNRCSVKMGVGQLMSGGKDESTATLYAASKQISASQRTRIVAEIEKNIKGLADSTVASKKGEIAPQIASGKDKAIAHAETSHKQLMSVLREVFGNNPAFANAFCFEAMSGSTKFGDASPARAKFIISTNADGSSVQLHDIDDAAYVSSIAKKVKVQVRFKSSQAERGGAKTGFYRYWSVVSLIMGKIEEEVQAAGPVLTEGIIKDIWGKMVNFVSGLWDSIVGWLTQTWENVIAFLGVEPDVVFNNDVSY